jgi:uncharacterized protein (DUF427 family)
VTTPTFAVEVIPVPGSDVGRALRFYVDRVGFTLDVDYAPNDAFAPRGAWQHIELPAYASELQARVAFAWPAMDAFYEEDERILGHAADSYHRIDIRQTSRSLVVRHRDRVVADTKRPVVLFESGFAPRWYVVRADVDESALTPVKNQTFCPYKGCAATTTLATHIRRHGRIVRPIPRSAASPTWCRSHGRCLGTARRDPGPS